MFQVNNTVEYVVKERKQKKRKTKTEQNGSVPQPQKSNASTDDIIRLLLRVEKNAKLTKEKKFKLKSNHAQGNHLGEIFIRGINNEVI